MAAGNRRRVGLGKQETAAERLRFLKKTRGKNYFLDLDFGAAAWAAAVLRFM
jgi:hypothetical protein